MAEQRLFIVLCLASLCLVVCAQTQVNVAGGRSYFVYPPPSNPGKVPLLLFLHGVTGDYTQAGQWSAAARSKGFLVIGGRGQQNHGRFGNSGYAWNAGGCCVDGGDDVAYVLNVVKDAVAKHNVDSKKVHLVGFSNGGLMTEYMLCKHPEVFKTAVSVAGMLMVPFSQCASGGSYNYLTLHGTADNVVPSGGPNPGQWRSDFAGWSAKMGCSNKRAVESEMILGANGWQTVHHSCRGNTIAELAIIPGLGHVVSNDEVAYTLEFITRGGNGGNNGSKNSTNVVHGPHGDIYDGRDYPGDDLPNTPIDNVASNIKCQALCFENKNCKAFVYGACHNVCWLKTSTEGKIINNLPCKEAGIIKR